MGDLIGLLKILFVGLLWEGSIRCNDPSVLRHKGLSEYLRYLKRKVWQFMIRNSLVAIQLPLLKGAKNVVQGEGIVLGNIFHLTGGCRAPVFCIMCPHLRPFVPF